MGAFGDSGMLGALGCGSRGEAPNAPHLRAWGSEGQPKVVQLQRRELGEPSLTLKSLDSETPGSPLGFSQAGPGRPGAGQKGQPSGPRLVLGCGSAGAGGDAGGVLADAHGTSSD